MILAETAAALRASGGSAVSFVVDLADADAADHVVDEAVSDDRAWRLVIGAHGWGEKELRLKVCALVEAQQLQWRSSHAEHPARDKACVLRKEAMLAPFARTHVTEPVADDEGTSVENAQRPLSHLRALR